MSAYILSPPSLSLSEPLLGSLRSCEGTSHVILHVCLFGICHLLRFRCVVASLVLRRHRRWLHLRNLRLRCRYCLLIASLSHFVYLSAPRHFAASISRVNTHLMQIHAVSLRVSSAYACHISWTRSHCFSLFSFLCFCSSFITLYWTLFSVCSSCALFHSSVCLSTRTSKTFRLSSSLALLLESLELMMRFSCGRDACGYVFPTHSPLHTVYVGRCDLQTLVLVCLESLS